MKISIPFGREKKNIQINLPSENFIIAQSRNPSASGTWAEVVGEAIRSPIGAEAINEQNLNGKKVVIITDDWGRPTPACEVVPLIIDELRLTGVRDPDITFVTASGMHDPMSREDLERKLGKEIVAKYRCISHDGGDWDNLAFIGISPQGTPIWVNRHVAEADYKMALGRIYLHEAYGYEGGYKMILPGVAGFDTIVRDHSFNFSADSIEGIHICVAAQEMTFEPKVDEPISEILRLHEKRNWDLSEREIQWRIKSLRGKFYNYRQIQEIQKRKVVLTPDPNAALQNVLAETGTDIWLVVLPEARTTLPKEKLY